MAGTKPGRVPLWMSLEILARMELSKAPLQPVPALHHPPIQKFSAEVRSEPSELHFVAIHF